MLIRGIKSFRQELSALLRRVQAGEEVLVTDHDRPIARVTAVRQGPGTLRSRRDLRESIVPRGQALSAVVLKERETGP